MTLPNMTARTVEGLGTAIVSGAYSGTRSFPNEAELLARFGISRVVVREAMKILAAKGLLASMPRRGTSVNPVENWNLLDPDVLRWLLSSNKTVGVLRELVQLRLAIEPEAAGLAASVGSVTEKQAILSAALACSVDGDRPVLESAFHSLVLKASGNRFLAQFSKTMLPMLNFTLTVLNQPAYAAGTGAVHRLRVAEAIWVGDVGLAKTAMHAVIELQTGFREHRMKLSTAAEDIPRNGTNV